MSYSDDLREVLTVARHHLLPVEDLRRLGSLPASNDEPYSIVNDIVVAVAENDVAPLDFLEQLAEDKRERVRCAVARNSSVTPELLTKLSHDSSTKVRTMVVSNLKCPVEILSDSRLLASEDTLLRNEIAHSPNTPCDVLIELTKDDAINVRCMAATNLNLVGNYLNDLLGSDDKDIVESMSGRPDLTHEQYLMLEERGDLIELAFNPATPADIVARLADHDNYEVRFQVANRKDTSIEILEKLAMDENLMVRKAALTNDETPMEVLRAGLGDDKRTLRSWAANRIHRRLELEGRGQR